MDLIEISLSFSSVTNVCCLPFVSVACVPLSMFLFFLRPLALLLSKQLNDKMSYQSTPFLYFHSQLSYIPAVSCIPSSSSVSFHSSVNHSMTSIYTSPLQVASSKTLTKDSFLYLPGLFNCITHCCYENTPSWC